MVIPCGLITKLVWYYMSGVSTPDTRSGLFISIEKVASFIMPPYLSHVLLFLRRLLHPSEEHARTDLARRPQRPTICRRRHLCPQSPPLQPPELSPVNTLEPALDAGSRETQTAITSSMQPALDRLPSREVEMWQELGLLCLSLPSLLLFSAYKQLLNRYATRTLISRLRSSE